MAPERRSRIPGFHALPVDERQALIAQVADLTADEIASLLCEAPLALATAARLTENTIGVYALPLGVALNFVVNGREVLVTIESMAGRDLTAIYAIGPGIDKDEPAEWSRRTGRVDGNELVFAHKGESTLRFGTREDGGLSATWISPDGGTKMKTGLRRIDPSSFLVRAAAR